MERHGKHRGNGLRSRTGCEGRRRRCRAADPAEFDAGKVGQYDAIAFGCPAMGEETLEEEVFAPMFESVKGALGGKKIALFGSYGWGDREWMQKWEEQCAECGATLACDSVTCMAEPDADALESCARLGSALAQ